VTADADPRTAPDVPLSTAAFDALLRAVGGEDGGDESEDRDVDEEQDGTGTEVAFEGLRVARDADGYTFESGRERHVGLSESELHGVAADHAAVVSNWHFWERVGGGDGPRRAFLRWVERAGERPVAERYAALADGVEREWGQLAITARLDDGGGRRYELRHADEADADPDGLDRYDDPAAARRLVTFDDDGRYRPLKTAPTLPTGWRFADLGPRGLYETVEAVYPATVANWQRERRGELDVTHWHEAVERQTGIYGVVRTWDRGEGHEHVERVAEACCDDSQCLKRREWEYDAETELDADGGDGVFPCREPCSVVIAAARKWTRLEGERPRTYEFELTPSEKEQIESIIDAVADGRTDEIREADVDEGANRYRARFLRAKRFDDDGNLCGVPTDPEEDDDENGRGDGDESGSENGDENEDEGEGESGSGNEDGAGA